MPRLTEKIQASVAALSRNSASVKAVMSMEENRFTRALDDLQRLCIAKEIPIAIVGGLAAIRYGYPAVTEDIDVAVARTHLDAFLNAAPEFGFNVVWESRSGWHTLTHGDVEINIVPEGGKARDSSPTLIPGPKQLGVNQGLDYASLAGWIELKISSNRQKDRAHIVEVMKKTETETARMVHDHLAQVHESYLQIFEQLADEAKEEQQQEQQRGQR